MEATLSSASSEIRKRKWKPAVAVGAGLALVGGEASWGDRVLGGGHGYGGDRRVFEEHETLVPGTSMDVDGRVTFASGGDIRSGGDDAEYVHLSEMRIGSHGCAGPPEAAVSC